MSRNILARAPERKVFLWAMMACWVLTSKYLSPSLCGRLSFDTIYFSVLLLMRRKYLEKYEKVKLQHYIDTTSTWYRQNNLKIWICAKNLKNLHKMWKLMRKSRPAAAARPRGFKISATAAAFWISKIRPRLRPRLSQPQTFGRPRPRAVAAGRAA